MVKNYQFIRSVMGDKWMLDESAYEALKGVLVPLMNGEGWDFSEEAIEKEVSLYSLSSGKMESYDSFDAIEKEGIAILNISGVMLKEDGFCGEEGTASLANTIKAIDSNENIIGSVLVVDSPGGQVSGTENLATVIKNFSKPIVSFVDGMACSAAYWTSSQSDYIMLNGETSSVGSIGTMASWTSAKSYYEKMGVIEKTVRARKSKDKNENFRKAEEENDFEGLKDELDALNEVFIDSVKSARNVTDAELTGKVYLTEEAINNGLADGRGSLEDAIALVESMAGSFSHSGNSGKLNLNNSMAEKNENGFLGELKAFFGAKKSDAEFTQEDFRAKVEAVEAMEANVKTLSSDLAQAKSSNEGLKAENSDLVAKVEALEAEKSDLVAKVKAHDQASNSASTTVPKEDNGGDGEVEETFMTSIDAQVEAERKKLGYC